MIRDDDLRTAFQTLVTGELPPGFVDDVVTALPDRSSRRLAAWPLGIAVLAGVAAMSVLLALLRPDGDPPPSTGSSAIASATAAASPLAVGPIVLTVETTPGGARPPDDETPNELVFALRGRVARYHDVDWGRSRSEERTAYLTDVQVEALVAYAIGEGGMADALPEYPRGSFGPSGETIITLVSPQLTKTVTYGLAPGNLTRDDDPTLGGLPMLVDRLGHFSAEIEAGRASGGLASDDVHRAERIALGDDRFQEMLNARHSIEKVLPSDGDLALVYVILHGSAVWPSIAACDIGGSEGPVTGMVWLVDLANERILAVSPRWGDVDCLSG